MRSFALVLVGVALAFALPARGVAQDFVTPPPQILPAPPPPPPPPRIEVPKVPQMDETPSSPRAALPRRKSFGKRIAKCLDEAGALGLGPNERAAYSRSCANR